MICVYVWKWANTSICIYIYNLYTHVMCVYIYMYGKINEEKNRELMMNQWIDVT